MVIPCGDAIVIRKSGKNTQRGLLTLVKHDTSWMSHQIFFQGLVLEVEEDVVEEEDEEVEDSEEEEEEVRPDLLVMLM